MIKTLLFCLLVASTSASAAVIAKSKEVLQAQDVVETEEDRKVEFFRAVKVDNADAITRLLDAGFEPNYVEEERGDSGLMLAIRENCPSVIKVLLANGKTNLEVKAKNGDNALMLAAYKGNLAVVKALIARGAQVNRPDWTALHYAAYMGHQEIVSLLLEHSAYIDAEAPNKNTPIMMAALAGHIYVVKLLLDEGADATLKNDRGFTAMDLAIQGKHKDIVEGLQFRLNQAAK